jgi:hypothetical protein
MRKKQKRFFTIVGIIFGIAVYVLILNRVDQINIIGGDWNTITTSVISYMPSLMGIGLGFVLLIKDVGNYRTTAIRITMITGLIGVSLSGLFFELNTNGVWVDEIITASFTITDFQLIMVIASLLFGMILGLSK